LQDKTFLPPVGTPCDPDGSAVHETYNRGKMGRKVAISIFVIILDVPGHDDSLRIGSQR
jgi:hypothetical protein